MPNSLRATKKDRATNTKRCGIGDLAAEFGLSLRALRFYESRGFLSPIREGLTRYYGEEDRRRLKTIVEGRKLGFTLTEIGEMLAADMEKSALISMLTTPMLDTQINLMKERRAEISTALEELCAERDRRYAQIVATDAKPRSGQGRLKPGESG